MDQPTLARILSPWRDRSHPPVLDAPQSNVVLLVRREYSTQSGRRTNRHIANEYMKYTFADKSRLKEVTPVSQPRSD